MLEAALAFATDLAVNVPASSLAVIKQQARHHPLMPELKALHQSHQLMEALPPELNDEFREALKARSEKREPLLPPYDSSGSRARLAQALFGPDEFRSRSKL